MLVESFAAGGWWWWWNWVDRAFPGALTLTESIRPWKCIRGACVCESYCETGWQCCLQIINTRFFVHWPSGHHHHHQTTSVEALAAAATDIAKNVLGPVPHERRTTKIQFNPCDTIFIYSYIHIRRDDDGKTGMVRAWSGLGVNRIRVK